jgi:hypothetical protein
LNPHFRKKIFSVNLGRKGNSRKDDKDGKKGREKNPLADHYFPPFTPFYNIIIPWFSMEFLTYFSVRRIDPIFPLFSLHFSFIMKVSWPNPVLSSLKLLLSIVPDARLQYR